MIELSTLNELRAQGKAGKALVAELVKLVEPRDFSQNYDPDPEKHRVVGQASEKTARLCEVTRQVSNLRKRPNLSEEEDTCVADVSIHVASARERSLKADCKNADPRVKRGESPFIRKGGVIVVKKS